MVSNSPRGMCRLLRRAVWCVGLACGLAACRVASDGFEERSSPAVWGSAPAVESTPSPVEPERTSHSITSGCETAFSDRELYLYVQGGLLWRQFGNGMTEMVTAITGDDGLLDAARAEGYVVVLRESGLQAVRLTDGQTTEFQGFDAQALFGELLVAEGTDRVAYSVSSDDRSELGVFDVKYNLRSPLIEGADYLKLIGFTNGNRILYAVPRGQDLEFASVLRIDTSTDEAVSLPVEGVEFAAVSPTDETLVTTAARPAADSGSLRFGLSLYEAPEGKRPPEWIDLPMPPSHASGLVFSDDGRSLDFVLRSDTPYDRAVTPYGLWRLDIASRGFSRLAELPQQWLHILGEVRAGNGVILGAETGDQVLVVDREAGDRCRITYLEGPVLVVK